MSDEKRKYIKVIRDGYILAYDENLAKKISEFAVVELTKDEVKQELAAFSERWKPRPTAETPTPAPAPVAIEEAAPVTSKTLALDAVQLQDSPPPNEEISPRGSTEPVQPEVQQLPVFSATALSRMSSDALTAACNERNIPVDAAATRAAKIEAIKHYQESGAN